MKLINDHLAVKARLLPTTGDGFVVLAGEAGTWRGHFPSPPARLAARLKALAANVKAREADVFRAVFRTPARATSCWPPGASSPRATTSSC